MPVKAKYIKDLPLKRVLDGSESLLVQDLNGTQQAPLGTIVDEIQAQTNVELSTKATKSEVEIERKRIELAGITIKTVGTYKATIKLYEAQTAEIHVVVKAQETAEDKAAAKEKAAAKAEPKEEAAN